MLNLSVFWKLPLSAIDKGCGRLMKRGRQRGVAEGNDLGAGRNEEWCWVVRQEIFVPVTTPGPSDFKRLPLSLGYCTDPPRRQTAASLTIGYTGSAKPGDWLEALVDWSKAGKQIVCRLLHNVPPTRRNRAKLAQGRSGPSMEKELLPFRAARGSVVLAREVFINLEAAVGHWP